MVPSDLFTVGRTLAALCTVLDRTQHRYTIPGPGREPSARHDSLYRFLLRATAFGRRTGSSRPTDGRSSPAC